MSGASLCLAVIDVVHEEVRVVNVQFAQTEKQEEEEDRGSAELMLLGKFA